MATPVYNPSSATYGHLSADRYLSARRVMVDKLIHAELNGATPGQIRSLKGALSHLQRQQVLDTAKGTR